MNAVRVALALSVLALIGSFGAISAGLVANDSRIKDIQRSRLEAARASCEVANQQNRAIVRFVTTANPDLRVQVTHAFPLIRDCTVYAQHRVRLK